MLKVQIVLLKCLEKCDPCIISQNVTRIAIAHNQIVAMYLEVLKPEQSVPDFANEILKCTFFKIYVCDLIKIVVHTFLHSAICIYDFRHVTSYLTFDG